MRPPFYFHSVQTSTVGEDSEKSTNFTKISQGAKDEKICPVVSVGDAGRMPFTASFFRKTNSTTPVLQWLDWNDARYSSYIESAF